MNSTVIIPARGGSKGIPRKNLQLVNGVPLVARAIRTARAACSISEVVVSTDDQEIADLACAEGAGVVWRPADISGDAASSESALLHAVGVLELAADDLIVFMQCTSPLTSSSDLDGLVELFLAEHADSAFTVTPFHGFIWRRGTDRQAVAVNHDANVRFRRQDLEPEYLENGALYAFSVGGFVKHRHRFFGRTVMFEMPAVRCLDIDSPDDLLRAGERLCTLSDRK
jgi:CMP-N-acetylneuraminic acid synthetase